MIYYFCGILCTLAAGFLSYRYLPAFTINRNFLKFLAGTALVFLFCAGVLKYLTLHVYNDFSHWLQTLFAITKILKPLSLSHEMMVPSTLNYFSVHFVPLLYFFALPFSLITHPVTLIFLNVFIMASSAIPLYKLALLEKEDRDFALFMVVVLFWYLPFQYTVIYEFEMLRFGIPLVLWMLYCLRKQKIAWYFVFVVLTILVREEAGLTIVLFGIYLFIFEKKRSLSFVTLLLGIAGFLAITNLIMPALREGSSYSHIAADLFNTFSLRLIFHPIKLVNFFMFLFPLLFIPLCAPTVLLSTLVCLGIGLLSESFIHSSFMLYYMSLAFPFLLHAFIKGWYKIIKPSNQSRAINTSLIWIFTVNIFWGVSFLSLQFWFKNIKPAPFRTQNFHYSVYKVSRHHRAVEHFIKQIPDSAIVSTQQFLSSRLYRKKGILIFPDVESKDGKWKADYILFDVSNNELKPQSPAFIKSEFFSMIAMDKQTWELIASQNNYFLYKRILQ